MPTNLQHHPPGQASLLTLCSQLPGVHSTQGLPTAAAWHPHLVCFPPNVHLVYTGTLTQTNASIHTHTHSHIQSNSHTVTHSHTRTNSLHSLSGCS